MRDRGKRKGRKTETWLILPFKCRVMVTKWTVLSAMMHFKWQRKSMHQWGTNERDSVMVRYVTLCENSVKLWKKGVRMCHHFPLFLDSSKSRSPGAVWTDLSRVEGLARIDLRGLECVHFSGPEGIGYLFSFFFQRSMLEGVEVGEGVPLAVPPQPCPFT